MSGRADVPLTGSVLAWAIAESGHTADSLAQTLGVSRTRLREWIDETERPSKTEFSKLAQQLRRPTAVFFLPQPPQTSPVQTEFRTLPGSRRSRLRPSEARWLRRAHLLQDLSGWVLGELDEAPIAVPSVDPDEDALKAAAAQRAALGVTVQEQLAWATPTEALEGWRRAVEALGVVTLELALGKDKGASRGVSLWDERAPVIVLNKQGNNPQSRAYTLMHEYGHLLHRRSSVCIGYVSIRPDASSGRQAERWCDRFAAGVLMPSGAFYDEAARVSEDLSIQEFSRLDHIRPLAKAFKVSMRAATLRLIDLGLAPESLYGAVSRLRYKGRKGGTGVPRPQMRVQQYGNRLLATLLEGSRADLIGTHELMRTLDVSSDELSIIAESVEPRTGG